MFSTRPVYAEFIRANGHTQGLQIATNVN